MTRIDYDLHIHTEYCGHAQGMTVEKICRQADKLELRLIAITDHTYSREESTPADLIRMLAESFTPRCQVLVGAEVDVDGSFDDGRLVVDDLDDYDYVVAGFHYVPVLGHYPRDPNERGMDSKQFLKVWTRSLLGIVSNPQIDTLAHPARLFSTCADLDQHTEEGLEVFKEAARLSAENQIAWELNELDGFRVPAAFQNALMQLFENALEAGVKLIYGSDAHTPEAIGKCRYVTNWLEYLGRENLSRPEDILGKKI